MLKNIAIAATLVAATLSAAPAFACDGEGGHAKTAEKKTEINSLTVDQLATRIEDARKNKANLAIFDANSAETRSEKGIIPTAVLLPSSSNYDTALLPKNKSDDVVFYCSVEKCSASKTAAKRALSAGYTSVHVLPVGIVGWVNAGKPTEKVSAQPAPKTEDKPLRG